MHLKEVLMYIIGFISQGFALCNAATLNRMLAECLAGYSAYCFFTFHPYFYIRSNLDTYLVYFFYAKPSTVKLCSPLGPEGSDQINYCWFCNISDSSNTVVVLVQELVLPFLSGKFIRNLLFSCE